jgi:manganese transport protein
LVLSQVVLSMQLGFAVIPLIHFTSSKKIMNSFANKLWVKIAAWLTATIIISLNIKLVIDEVTSLFETLGGDYLVVKIIVLSVLLYVLGLLIYIIVEPLLSRGSLPKNPIPHDSVGILNSFQKVIYKHIAITVDFSKNDQLTIQHALNIGGKEATYLLIHIVESAGAIRLKEQVLDKETIYDTEYLQKYQNDLQQLGYIVTIQLGFGKSANTIADLVNKTDSDLLVMGAHGHKAIQDFIFGSTVDAVRHNVKIPVLVVK